MAERNVLISLTNMKKYFPLKKTKLFQRERLYVKANDGISIDIFEGETFGLVGESGCGKSTLGRVLLQLFSQTDGRTMYYGRTRDDLAPRYVARLLSHLSHLIQQQKHLESERQSLQSQYDSLHDEKARWALIDRLSEATKKARDLYADIAKIVGGFVACGDPEEVSRVFLAEYHVSVESARLRRELRALEAICSSLSHEAEADISPRQKAAAAKRLLKIRGRIPAVKQQLEAADACLKENRKQVEALRARFRGKPEFEENEKLLDSGIDLSRLTSEEMRILRKDLQLIFQDPYSSLNPRMTVGQLIGEGLLAHDFYHKSSPKMQDYILDVMDSCGLANYMLHRYPHQFSGGQRQRIGIARALALKPRFVVCDEAVSALDVSIQSQVLNLLMDLKEKENLTYLFISHDLSVIKYISDRIGVMYLGNMVELATSEELFRNPLHPYTEALLAAIPTTDVDASRDIVPIEGDIPSAIKPPKGCKFHTRCRYVMDVCRQVTPEFKEISPGHCVACHLRNPI